MVYPWMRITALLSVTSLLVVGGSLTAGWLLVGNKYTGQNKIEVESLSQPGQRRLPQKIQRAYESLDLESIEVYDPSVAVVTTDENDAPQWTRRLQNDPHRDVTITTATSEATHSSPPQQQQENFEKGRYLRQPQLYLEQVRPSRMQQTAPPTAGVVPLLAESQTLGKIMRGGSIKFTARGTPGMPVTFHTKDGGVFGNGHQTVSVAFDKLGLADVVFRSDATANDRIAVIEAASPVHSGKVQFVVELSRWD